LVAFDMTLSYLMPTVSISVIVALLVCVHLSEMVFGDTSTHVGIGLVAWVVAPVLFFVSVKEPLANVMLIAFAKLSFVGAGAITTNVGNVTVEDRKSVV